MSARPADVVSLDEYRRRRARPSERAMALPAPRAGSTARAEPGPRAGVAGAPAMLPPRWCWVLVWPVWIW